MQVDQLITMSVAVRIHSQCMAALARRPVDAQNTESLREIALELQDIGARLLSLAEDSEMPKAKA